MSRVTTVLGNGESLSCLNGRARAAAGDETRQPRAVEHALVEIEAPLARLPRHQHAHQPLGEPRDDGAGGAELGLEPRVQLDELVAAGQRERR